MSAPEKRRGGGGHVLRSGPSHTARHSHATGPSANSNTGSDNSSSMPAMPPRAAMVNINAAVSAEDTHDNANTSASSQAGGAPLAEKEKENSGPSRSGSARNSAKEKQRERDRTAALIRDKDDRIATLMKEKVDLAQEFNRQLDELSQAERETATFWQNKHSGLNQQFLRTDTELRLLHSKVDAWEAERSKFRERLELMRQEVKERDDEIGNLRIQVRDMKKFVSTSTRTDGQTSDEVFGDGMAKLANGLQNWVITHFRRAKPVDFSKLDEATLAEVSELVPMYEELAQGAKLHLLQSIVSKTLVEMVFGIYFLGLSDEQMQHFWQIETTLASLVLSEESVNQWRAYTLALLRRDAPQLLQGETGTHIEKVISRINRILDTITTDGGAPAVGTSRSDTRDSSLRTLVNNSVGLARLLVAQKAVLRVYMPEVLPHQQVMFDPETMEDVGGEDEESLARREIWCVVFPGVVKHGDENGGQMQFRNIIAKARVLCSPED
ncbi:hypothetical protein QQS21_008328 [Conoideocrella luteorostrata]|uniref:Involucrin repeat protein n=1 Tax=Conoideocrella luteorostrata TaxID=1105319 RepID=A0AAJ0FW42_9HYPO|nr:hypothetical protein QQS21_008328 [Conoideocrella luteorostrata]